MLLDVDAAALLANEKPCVIDKLMLALCRLHTQRHRHTFIYSSIRLFGCNFIFHQTIFKYTTQNERTRISNEAKNEEAKGNFRRDQEIYSPTYMRLHTHYPIETTKQTQFKTVEPTLEKCFSSSNLKCIQSAHYGNERNICVHVHCALQSEG